MQFTLNIFFFPQKLETYVPNILVKQELRALRKTERPTANVQPVHRTMTLSAAQTVYPTKMNVDSNMKPAPPPPQQFESCTLDSAVRNFFSIFIFLSTPNNQKQLQLQES